MKLSTAIRDGAKLRPQAFKGFFKDGGSCAIGAAQEAFEGTLRSAMSPDFIAAFPVLNRPAVCPLCPVQLIAGWEVVDAIIHLNDEHRWTREAIADFVEQFEAATV